MRSSEYDSEGLHAFSKRLVHSRAGFTIPEGHIIRHNRSTDPVIFHETPFINDHNYISTNPDKR